MREIGLEITFHVSRFTMSGPQLEQQVLAFHRISNVDQDLLDHAIQGAETVVCIFMASIISSLSPLLTLWRR